MVKKRLDANKDDVVLFWKGTCPACVRFKKESWYPFFADKVWMRGADLSSQDDTKVLRFHSVDCDSPHFEKDREHYFEPFKFRFVPTVGQMMDGQWVPWDETTRHEKLRFVLSNP